MFLRQIGQVPANSAILQIKSCHFPVGPSKGTNGATSQGYEMLGAI